MIIRRLIPVYGSATLFLMGIARAQPTATDASPVAGSEVVQPALAPPAHHPHPLTPQEQELLRRYDKNGDGKLDAAELDAAHGAAYQAKLGRDVLARQLYDRLLEQFDTGHAGKLNGQQQKDAIDFLQDYRPRIYELLARQFDRNGDGKLDAKETTAVFQYFSGLPSDLSDVARAKAPDDPVATAAPTLPVPAPAAAASSPANAPAGRATPISDSARPEVALHPAAAGPASVAMAGPDLAASLDAVPATPPPKAKGEKGGRGGAMGTKFYGLLLDRFDHDHTGSLTPVEQAQAVTYLASNNPRLYARLVGRFDRDGDGRLDANETAHMFERLSKLHEGDEQLK